MKETSDKKFSPVAKGATVRVSIPDVVKGEGDRRNKLVVVIEVTDDGFGKLGTANGNLISYTHSRNSWCASKALSVLKMSLIMKPDFGPELQPGRSSGSGQGCVRCSYKTKG